MIFILGIEMKTVGCYGAARVKFWKSILTLLLLALWLPATAHCGLEAVGLVPMDECCDSAPNGDHKSDNACKIVEDSSFKTECSATLPAPPELLVFVTQLLAVPCASEADGLDITETIPSSYRLPQFLIKTALPIRGPSSVS